METLRKELPGHGDTEGDRGRQRGRPDASSTVRPVLAGGGGVGSGMCLQAWYGLRLQAWYGLRGE